MGASTALTDAYRGNARTNQRELDSSLSDLGDRQIGLKTGLMGQRLGLLSSRQGGRESMQAGQNDQNLSLQQGRSTFEPVAHRLGDEPVAGPERDELLPVGEPQQAWRRARWAACWAAWDRSVWATG